MASASLSHVAIKVELASGERSSVLYDSSGAPLHELAPGDNMEAVVKQVRGGGGRQRLGGAQ